MHVSWDPPELAFGALSQARNELQRVEDEEGDGWEDYQAPAAGPPVLSAPGGGDDSDVTSRLSALKARLATEKAKSSGRQAEITRH